MYCPAHTSRSVSWLLWICIGIYNEAFSADCLSGQNLVSLWRDFPYGFSVAHVVFVTYFSAVIFGI